MLVGSSYVKIYELYVLICWWGPHGLKYMEYMCLCVVGPTCAKELRIICQCDVGPAYLWSNGGPHIQLRVKILIRIKNVFYWIVYYL